MKRPLALWIVLPLFFLASFASLSGQSEAKADERTQKIYRFEHRTLPNWVHTSKGEFFNALLKGGASGLKRMAHEFVDEPFAAQLAVRTIVPEKAVLITFEPPAAGLLCYYAIVAKTEDGYAYYTLEKTFGVGSDKPDSKAMYCAWTAQGKHENYGPRDYTAEDKFVAEFLAASGREKPLATTTLKGSAE